MKNKSWKLLKQRSTLQSQVPGIWGCLNISSTNMKEKENRKIRRPKQIFEIKKKKVNFSWRWHWKWRRKPLPLPAKAKANILKAKKAMVKGINSHTHTQRSRCHPPSSNPKHCGSGGTPNILRRATLGETNLTARLSSNSPSSLSQLWRNRRQHKGIHRGC